MGNKKTTTLALSLFLLTFYMLIIMYLFFGVLHIDLLENCFAGMLFQCIGFLILCVLVLGQIVARPIKAGYFAPIVLITAFYTLILDVMNCLAIMLMPTPLFFFLHLLLLFVYCIVTVPMYLMGRK